MLGVYLFLMLVAIEVAWALDPYVGFLGFWFLIGQFALLSMIFLAIAYVKRTAKGEQHDLPALRGNSEP